MSFNVTLDVNPALNLPALQKMFGQLKTVLEGVPNVDFLDSDKLEAEIKRIQAQFDKLGPVAQSLQQALDKVSLDDLQKSLDNLSGDDLAQFATELQGDLDKVTIDKLKDGFAAAAKEFTTAKAQASSGVQAQEQVLARLVAGGKKNTEEYKAATRELDARRQKLTAVEQGEKKVLELAKSVAKAEKDATAAVGAGNAQSGSSFAQRAAGAGGFIIATQALSQAMNEVVTVGNDFEATLAAVGAVTGQSGEGLDKLGVAARDLAKEFGTGASENLKSFQGILSKFGPQVAENAEALKLMGSTVNTLSAASGDAADVSMAALTDTMLQLGLVSGDAAKDAETMVKVADALAASAKVGAAEIPQVAQSILQTGVAAKGAKLSLEQTTAAIQVLAVGGKVGSEAGIALRNVLGLLQKQSGPGSTALANMGTSVEELGAILTTQGLQAALGKLSQGLDTIGTTAERNATLMTLFGTENSAAAGILIDNAKLLTDFQNGIGDAVTAGAKGADGAVAQASVRLATADSLSNKIQAQVQDAFIRITQTVGTGVSGILAATTKIAPGLSALSQVKNLLPEGSFGKAKDQITGIASKVTELGGLSGKLSPLAKGFDEVSGAAKALGSTAFGSVAKEAGKIAAPLKNAFSAAADGIGPVVENVGKFGPQIAEKLRGLNGVAAKLGPALFNPYTLGAVAAAAAITLFFTKTEVGQKIFARLKEKASELFERLRPLIEGAQKVLSAFLDVLSPIGEFIVEYITTPFEVAFAVIDAGSQIFFDLIDGLLGSADGADASSTAFDAIAEAIGNVAQYIQAGVDGFKLFKDVVINLVGGASTILSAFVEYAKVAINPVNWLDGDESAAREKLAKTLEGAIKGAIKKANDSAAKAGLDKALENAATIKADLDKNDKIGDLVGKLEKAKTEAEKNSIAAELEKQVPGAVKATGAVVDAQGNITKSYEVNIDAAKKYAAAQKASLGDQAATNAKKVAAGIQAQAGAYEEAAVKAEALKAKIAQATVQGKDTKALQEQLKSQLAVVEEQGTKVSESLQKSIGSGVDLGDIKLPKNFQAQFQGELAKIEIAAREAKIGEKVGALTALKGDLDKQNRIGGLVEKLKNAKTEAEKNSISKEIARQAPELVSSTKLMVDANGKLTETFTINAEEAAKSTAANKGRISGDLLKAQKEYNAEIDAEGKRYQDVTAKSRALAQQINETQAAGGDTTKQREELAALQKEQQKSQGQVVALAVASEKYGATQEESIKRVMESTGKSREEAKKLVDKQRELTIEGGKSKQAIGDLAGAYDEARQAAQKAITESVSGLLQLQQDYKAAKEKGDKDEAARLQARIAQEKTKTKATVAGENEAKKVKEKLEEELGLKEKEKGQSAYELAKAAFDQREKQLSIEEKMGQLARQENLLAQERDANAFDEIVAARETLKIAEQRKKAYLEELATRKLITITADGAVQLSQKGLTKDERAEITEKLKAFEVEAKDQALNIKGIEVKIRADKRELDQAISDFERQKLQVQIDLGYKTNADLSDLLQKDLDLATQDVADATQKLNQFEASYAKERLKILMDGTEEDLKNLEFRHDAELLALNQNLIKVKKSESDAARAIRDNKVKIYETEIKDIEDLYASEKAIRDAALQSERDYQSHVSDLVVAGRSLRSDLAKDDELAAIDDIESAKLAAIESWVEEGVLAEEEGERRKAAIQAKYQGERVAAEENHRKELQRIAALATGERVLLDTVAAAKQAKIDIDLNNKKVAAAATKIGLTKDQEQEYLDIKLEFIKANKKAVENVDDEEAQAARAAAKARVDAFEAAAAIGSVDASDFESIATALAVAQDTLETKGSAVAEFGNLLQTTVTDSLTNLFNGDPKAVADSFRELFAQLAGALQAKASGFVLDLFLSSGVAKFIGAIPFPFNLGAMGAAKLAIDQGVKAITRPLLAPLLSFSTGGRIDRPTLAMIGDGAKLGGSNKEWMFRDDQLIKLMAQTAGMGGQVMAQGLDRVEMAINNLEGRFYLHGVDLRNSSRRIAQNDSRRAR
ncbi:MAG: phage tail tape measure protein [Bacteroidetes bacterium]|nr:phage tail tape measure protein [Bacteroidota bacterium]